MPEQLKTAKKVLSRGQVLAYKQPGSAAFHLALRDEQKGVFTLTAPQSILDKFYVAAYDAKQFRGVKLNDLGCHDVFHHFQLAKDQGLFFGFAGGEVSHIRYDGQAGAPDITGKRAMISTSPSQMTMADSDVFLDPKTPIERLHTAILHSCFNSGLSGKALGEIEAAQAVEIFGENTRPVLSALAQRIQEKRGRSALSALSSFMGMQGMMRGGEAISARENVESFLDFHAGL